MSVAKSPRARAWTATVLTLFPEMFPGPLGLSLAGKALAAGGYPVGAGCKKAGAVNANTPAAELPEKMTQPPAEKAEQPAEAP